MNLTQQRLGSINVTGPNPGTINGNYADKFVDGTIINLNDTCNLKEFNHQVRVEWCGSSKCTSLGH